MAAGPIATLVKGQVRIVPIGQDKYGAPLEAILTRDKNDTPVAYLNLCQHLPVPLGPREYFDDEGLFICHLHGARYRVEDGYCVAGPCQDQALKKLELTLEDGQLFVGLPG